jgi:aspartokinase-like uncharacterized kinase
MPGGGPTADVIREFDRVHQLGEEHSHWLALRALALNAHFLAALLPGAGVVSDVPECWRAWDRRMIPILDLHAFAEADEGRDGSLPHHWTVTSDSLAARAAGCLGASHLVLLKSSRPPEGSSWVEAGRLGYVDACFGTTIPAGMELSAVNLRTWVP